MDTVTAILDEAIKETIGTSRKKWALVVVALAAGAMGALWLTRRTRSTGPAPTVSSADAATS
jgi:hypothetical protein